jgi:hypothetical protein
MELPSYLVRDGDLSGLRDAADLLPVAGNILAILYIYIYAKYNNFFKN